MSRVDSALKALVDREIALTLPQISQGAKSHTYVKDLLENKSRSFPTFPRILNGAGFLSGSYARGTKNHPLNDIDVMVVMDGTGLFAWSKGVMLDAEVKGTGEVQNPILNHLGSEKTLSSRKVLQLFHDALKQSHQNSSVSKDGQAVNIWLKSYNLGIDIVPAFHIVPRNGSRDFYYIPAGGNQDGWLMTNPKIDAQISDTFVKLHGEEFRNPVRLIKHWNKVHNNGRLRSYHLETVVWYVFSDHPGPVRSYEHGLRYFFDNCTSTLSNPCPDATKIGDSIDKNLSVTDRLLSLQKIDETRKAIRSGDLAELLNPGTNVTHWGRIFNESW